MLAAAIAVASLIAFNGMILELDVAEIVDSFWEIGLGAGALSCAATAMGYVAIGYYDVIATRLIAPHRVSPRLAAWSGMTAFAFSNFLGFHLLTGGMVRFRTYLRAGLDASEVGQIILMSWTGLWLGLGAVSGVILVLAPVGSPDDVVGSFASRMLGVLMLVGLTVLLACVGNEGRVLKLRGWQFPLPGRRHVAILVSLGAADILAAAAALYLLLPADINADFAFFLIVYVLAVALGTASHVPGGLGVFEATMIAGLGLQGRADALSVLLAYRLIYYVLPFLVATAWLGYREIAGIRSWIAPRLKATSRGLLSFVPAASATLVFGAGVVLLVTGLLPTPLENVLSLRRLLPLPVVEGSHFSSALVGLLLMVVANGLLRRLHNAWLLAIILLAAGATFALARGLNVGAAAALAGVALLLVYSRAAFYRRTPGRLERIPWSWLALVAVAIALVLSAAFLFYQDTIFWSSLWGRFTWYGDAPRFLRASSGIVAGIGIIALHILLTRPLLRPQEQGSNVPAAVREIVSASRDTDSNLALLGDKSFLISADETAFLMYSRSGGSIVSMGGPFGSSSASEELVWQFRELADVEGLRAVFYGVGPENLPLYLDLGYSFLKLGEVARIDLNRWSLQGSAAKEFRYVHRRAERDGLKFEVLGKRHVPAVMNELRRVSDAWLVQKSGREKSFSLGSFDPTYLANFDCALMRNAAGKIVAFANIWRSGDRTEISPDLMRYEPHVSNVLMDALFLHLIQYGQTEEYRWFNLGAAPLAGLRDHPLASTWNRIGTQVFRRGEEIYNFEGLRSFKQKYNPVWAPRYLACRGGLAIPQVLIDVTRLISREKRHGTRSPLMGRFDVSARHPASSR